VRGAMPSLIGSGFTFIVSLILPMQKNSNKGLVAKDLILGDEGRAVIGRIGKGAKLPRYCPCVAASDYPQIIPKSKFA